MLRKPFLLLFFVLLSAASYAQKGNPFFYELISNDSKTINFVFGFYPSTTAYTESSDIDPYTKIKGAVINNAKDNDLKWKDYKIMILLNNGKLIRNYTTAAESGDFACIYTVDGGDTRYQWFCFHQKFEDDDIDKVWLILSDDQVFSLIYDKNKD